jgi:RNA polymerase sigma-70 factor (ECF subfamily)
MGMKQSERSDVELMADARRDSAAFGELYSRHVEAVHAWLARRIGWAAADLTAETFAQAWLSRRRFSDRRGGSALPWLIGIARNVLLESVRRDRVATRARERLGLSLDLAADDAYTEVEDRLSLSQALARALDGLPDHERRALELRILDELPYEEVAAELEIQPAAARLRVSRALRRLALATSKEDL